jgi:hypothetical protein
MESRSKGRLRAYVIFAVSFTFVSLDTVSPANGYNPITHRQIVEDAIDFVDLPGLSRDGTVGVIQALTGLTEDDINNIARERLTAILGQSAFETDYKDDLFFRYTKWYGWLFAVFMDLDECFSRHKELSFTSMQHFMVIPQQPGRIWQIDGYSYEYTDRDRDDLDYLAFSSFVVDWSGVKLDTETCQRELPPWWRPDVYHPGNYENNTQQFLKHVTFPPASNMATYFYDKFLQDIGINGKPTSQALNYLGRVMHLIQDMTVPHHVIGTLGQNHQGYEKKVDALYAMRLAPLRDNRLIEQTIKSVPCLNSDCTITQMLNEVAEYTRRAEVNAGHLSIVDGRYTLEHGSDEDTLQRIRELVNLAIAANVALVRKAAKDWSMTHSGTDGSKRNSDIIPSRDEAEEKLYFDDFSQIRPEYFIGGKVLAILSGDDKAQLIEIMRSAQVTISGFVNGDLTRSEFGESIDEVTLRLEGFYRKQIVTHPELLSSTVRLNTKTRPSLSFRQPSEQERTNLARWRSYDGDRDKFAASIQFMNQTIFSAMIGIEEKHRLGTIPIPEAAIAGFDDSSNESVIRDLNKAKDKFKSFIRD